MLLQLKKYNSIGNWSPSDFPSGTSYPPRSSTKLAVNRDMLVSMEGEDIVNAFTDVFNGDWAVGTTWKPKQFY